MACKSDNFQGYLYLAFAGVWVLFVLWWCFNTWIHNASYARSLQRLIFFVLLFKTLHIGFHGCSRLFCNSAEDEAYWGLATTSTFTLYNTFLYTVMALISKGFCLIRITLNRSEVTSVAVIMGLVYLGFSAYLIEPADVAPVLLVIVGLLFFNSSKSSIQNLKLMQVRHYNLQQANILVLLPELAYKIRIMKWFIFFSYVFYVNELVKIALSCIGITLKLDTLDLLWVYESSVEVSLSTFSCFSIFYMFRAKPRPMEFNFSMSINEMPLAIAPILTASVPYNECAVNYEKPSIAYFPQRIENREFEIEDYELMIAMPIK